jgi:DNA-binding MarR family transcriptional regulator
LRPEETVDFQIKKTWQSISKMYNEVAAGYGVTMATGYVLLSIDREHGTPSTALGPKMGMEATSLSRILKSMESKNLIERKANPSDGRSVLVYLTPFGIEKREDARAAVINFNEQVMGRFNNSDLKGFFTVIKGINTMLQENKLATQELND